MKRFPLQDIFFFSLSEFFWLEDSEVQEKDYILSHFTI